ncbi:MAG: 16S rRNA methyltransferase, partial [Senegalia sp. (in: firmicutes)]
MNRFFVNIDNIKDENIIIDNKDDLKHMKNVLRLKE